MLEAEILACCSSCTNSECTQGEGSAASKAGVGRLANLGVTLQRRWANVLSDYTRQGVVECFLGLKLKEHFPTVSMANIQQPLPLNESEDDEADLESVAPGNIKDKVNVPHFAETA